MRTIVIAGGNGFLGTLLSKYFVQRGDSVIILARHEPVKEFGVSFEQWDARSSGSWSQCLESADVLINLAGKNVNCRYTEENKKEILNSRIESTAALGEALRKLKNPPGVWINASSATIYNASYTSFRNEDSMDIGDDFSMNVCKQWEHTFNNYRIPGVRKITARIGIVLGQGGGAFVPLQNLARMGFGGSQGEGDQYSSWIHAEDFCRAMEFFITTPKCKGVYNVTSPNPVTNNVFMKGMRESCGVKFGIPIPKALLEFGAVFIGTETELILKSRKVFPKRLLDEGFVFEFTDTKAALNNLCRNDVRKNNILSR
jgi:uncharacterized protein (TIGR01777 family)